MPAMMAIHAYGTTTRGARILMSTKAKRREYGITNSRIYRNAADPNDVVILFDVADEARVRAFGDSDDLRNIMEQVGVELPTVSIKALSD